MFFCPKGSRICPKNLLPKSAYRAIVGVCVHACVLSCVCATVLAIVRAGKGWQMTQCGRENTSRGEKSSEDESQKEACTTLRREMKRKRTGLIDLCMAPSLKSSV